MSSDPRDDAAVLYCLPIVPLPSIATSVGFALYQKLHRWKKPSHEAHWTETELRSICSVLALPVPYGLQTQEERAAAAAVPF